MTIIFVCGDVVPRVSQCQCFLVRLQSSVGSLFLSPSFVVGAPPSQLFSIGHPQKQPHQDCCFLVKDSKIRINGLRMEKGGRNLCLSLGPHCVASLQLGSVHRSARLYPRSRSQSPETLLQNPVCTNWTVCVFKSGDIHPYIFHSRRIYMS